jgi:hypothetical protein
VRKLDPAAPLGENAARIVRVRCAELRSFAEEALAPENEEAQHDMRIAAKRLRYVLEVTEACFGDAGKEARKRARDVQQVLGELHDCDVMLPRLERHLAELRELDADAVLAKSQDADDLEAGLAAQAPHRTCYRGLEVLAVFLRARRKLLFESFGELWDEIEDGGTWDALDRAATRIRREAKEAASLP